MRFLLDVDGVICDFLSGYLELVHQATGRLYTPADVTDFDFKALAMSDAERERVEKWLFQYGWVVDLQALDGAVAAVHALIDRGHEIVFVTSPWRGHPTWAHERAEWLAARFPDPKIISTNQKHCIAGDVLIDDKPEHVVSWQAAHRQGLGVLWDAPYNRDATGLTRCSSWAEVLPAVFGPVVPCAVEPHPFVNDERGGL